MNIQELSDEKLSRWIAEKIEPKPEGEPWTVPLDSPLRVWHASIASAICDGRQPAYWKLRDMVSDPAMTVMLMEKLLSVQRLDIWTHFAGGDVHINTLNPLIHGCSKTLGRSVAMTFALANGWTDEEGRT